MNKTIKLVRFMAVAVLAFFIGFTFCVSAETADETIVVYVMDGGSGDGSSAENALGSLVDAYNAIGDANGKIVICGSYDIPVYSSTGSGFLAPAHAGTIVITSVHGDVDYRETADASLHIAQNFYLGGTTKIDGVLLVCDKNYLGILAAYNSLTIGDDVVCKIGEITSEDGTTTAATTYPSIVSGTYRAATDVSAYVEINSGKWQRVRLGNSTGTVVNAATTLVINGGETVEGIKFGSLSYAHSGDIDIYVNGGKLSGGITGVDLGKAYTFSSVVNVNISGGTVYGSIKVDNNTSGTLDGEFNVKLEGGNFAHLTDLVGTADVNGTMTSTLEVSADVNFEGETQGAYSFTNPIRTNGADPWLFYHDGYYYYTATAGTVLRLYKAANIGDLATAAATSIYTPEAGNEWSANLWSPEIHYFGAEDVGEEYAGWYCFLGSTPDDAYNEANGTDESVTSSSQQRAYVIKCLDGDNLLGRWGNPLTGEVNVPQKIEFPDSDFNKDELTGGCSVITINGVKYITFVSEVGRETGGTEDFNFYQTINIAKFTNPWTIEGEPKVICVPEYDWEKGGSEDGIHPEVVEGSTAVYGPNGEVYIIYSGSGYWTAKYQLGQLTYIGGANGDPTDINNWEKKPTSIFSQSDELVGCGHASYVTDTDGQGWICYHAYPKGHDTRYAYVEPYYFTDEGVVIGEGTGHPASPSKIYTRNVNPMTLASKTAGFTSVVNNNTVGSVSNNEGVKLDFTAVTGATGYDIYRNGEKIGESQTTTYIDTVAPAGRYTYTVVANKDGVTLNSCTISNVVNFAPLAYGDMDENGEITVNDVMLVFDGVLNNTLPDARLVDVLRVFKLV